MVTFLTPRHYLDFVNHYVRLYIEKRDDLEEQQRHLNVGLEKLNDTVKKVSELRASLAEKQKQLERTNAEANAKLQQMVADQKETEQKRLASLEIQTALDQQELEIAERTEIVLEDLAKAEPAVVEARKSVSNIKKQHLTEVRSMQNPPEAVKLAMESVCSLLGNRVDGWKSVQAVIRRDDFIPSIVNYDNERQMTKALRYKMQTEYLSNPAFTFEIVNRASKACGPLVQWVAAQVNYSAILDRVGPLREEVKTLQSQAEETRMKAETITEMIEELAQECRNYWRLGDGPIADLVLLLENNGVIVSRGDLVAESLDAYSQWPADSAHPFIFLAADKASAVRSRHDASHELGHLILHRHLDAKTVRSPALFKLMEAQAHRFAGAFNLPAKSFANQLWAPTLDAFVALKPHWRVAVSAMIKRCEDLGILSEEQTRRSYINLNRRGWRREEPLDDRLTAERPRMLRRSFELLINEAIKTPEQILLDLAINPGDVEVLACLEPGYLSGVAPNVTAMPQLKEHLVTVSGNIVRFKSRN